jgi:predicted Zn-dependent peptidase
MEFLHRTLDNGLTIVGEVKPDAASTAMGFFARTGSRDEWPAVSGVSHFLEHMMFKGTARRTAFDVNREFDEMGARYNAFTSEENTVYYGAVLPEYREALADLLCDILRPSLRPEDFDTEKNVILEEISLYDDLPPFRVHERLMAVFFDGHPLGNSILGTRESIAAMKRDDMQEYFDRRYSPRNLTLCCAGNFDFDALCRQVESLTAGWKSFDCERALPAPPNPRRREAMHDADVQREHIAILAPAPSMQDDRAYAAQVAASILGDSSGSRLYYALIETALADEAHTHYMPMDQAGAYYTSLSADPDSASKALEVAEAEMRRLREDGPTDAELTAARNKIASATTLEGELPMGRLTAVGFDWVYRGEYVSMAEHVRRTLAVSREQVLGVLGEFDLSATSVCGLGPLESL